VYKRGRDLYRIGATTQRDEVDCEPAYIPKSFDAPHPHELDTDYVRELYPFACQRTASGSPREKLRPGLDPGGLGAKLVMTKL